MSKLTWIIAGLSASFSVLMTVAIERRAASRQSAQADALKEQSAQFAQATAENTRLSNLVARLATLPSPSPADLRELLRLRNEAGQLRGLDGRKSQLETTNAQLRELDKKSQETLARARALPNYWPKEQLAFAGYAEPEATLKSFLAAMKNGDLNALENCLDPASAAELEADRKKDGGDPTAREAEIKTEWNDFLAGVDGFHIVDQTMTDSNQVTIKLSFDGPARVQKMVLTKIGGDWKFTGGN